VEWNLLPAGEKKMPIALFDTVTVGLTRALSLHHRRHELLATNIANIETPGYRAQDLEFKGALRAAFESDEVDAEAGRVIDKPSGVARPDGNTVDVDMEMARLTDNRSSYTTFAEILARRFAGLRRAIEGGR
jgi:flagellar basal-body rod protein FlgB